MTDWAKHSFADRIRDILAAAPAQEHHLGRPFLSAYQIAIEFALRHPDALAEMDIPIGGVGSGPRSLAQYIGRELSRRCGAGELPEIGGGFFSDLHLASLSFRYQGQEIASSLRGA
jgi:hypothetical protein